MPRDPICAFWASVIEVLDRVLHKGIVIDAWVRLLLVGASIATDLQHSRVRPAPG